jgi:predicted lipoprotein with Yx(FWY)xxD motif
MFVRGPRNDSTYRGACSVVWPPMLTKGIPKAEGTAAADEPSAYKRDDGATR